MPIIQGTKGGQVYTTPTLSTTITIPPVEQVDADVLSVLTFNLNLTNPITGLPNSGSIWFSVAPSVSATGEVLKNQMQNIKVDDVLSKATEDNTLSDLLDALNAYVLNHCQINGLYGMSAPVVETPPVIEAIP